MAKDKVLIKEKIAETGVKKLEKDFEVVNGVDWDDATFLKELPKFEAIIIRSATKMTSDLIEKAKNLKIIGRAGIGVDNVDLDAATKRGIIVANAPQSNIISAAEHSLALLMAAARQIPKANESLSAGKWERSKFQGIELYGKTLGVLGYGKIGSLVAQRAQAFGMKVIAYDPYISGEKAKKENVEVAKTLDDFLKVVDIITTHLPKTKETLGMIGAKEIKKMKDGVIIINAARGGIINEEALVDGVNSGKVAAAGLDVYEKEPCTDSPAFGVDNIVVTPHLGASTTEAQDKAGITIAEQVELALKGEFVQYAVNIDVAKIEDAVKPFMPLAERLGKLLYHLVEGQIDSVTVKVAGELADSDTDILTVAVLKGLFEPVAHEPVTYVNAPLMAKERGIETQVVKTEKSTDYLNLISVTAGSNSKKITVAGTLVGPKNQERFVNIYDFDIDMVPSKHMAFFRYKDVPGMIGKVGTILGENKTNIANMQVGRKKLGGEALMGINVDAELSQEILERIKTEAGIADATSITI